VNRLLLRPGRHVFVVAATVVLLLVSAPLRGVADADTTSPACTSLSVAPPNGLIALSVREALECRLAPNVELQGSLVAGSDGVWVTTFDSGHPEILRLDPSTLTVTAQVPLAAQATVLRSDGLWLLQKTEEHVGGVDTDVFALVQVNRHNGQIMGAVPLPIAAPHSSDDRALLATTADALWISESTNHMLVRINPSDSQVTARIALSGRPEALTATPSTVWADVSSDPAPLTSYIVAIDPARAVITRQIACRCVDKGPLTGLVATPHDVWFSGTDLVHIDATTRTVTKTRTDEVFGALATDGHSAWVIDPTPIEDLSPLTSGHQPVGLVTRLAARSLQPQAGTQLPLNSPSDLIDTLSTPTAHTLWMILTREPSADTTLIRLTLTTN
jgi:hypothetical protein